jgi:sugar phosphate permease
MQCLVRSKEVSSHGHADLKASLLSWQVWVLGIAYCATVFGLTGLVFWMPQIIKQFKFTDTTVGLLSTIPYIIGAVIMCWWAARSDARKERFWHFIIPSLIFSAGFIVTALSTSPWTSLFGMVISTSAFLSAVPVYYTLISLFSRRGRLGWRYGHLQRDGQYRRLFRTLDSWLRETKVRGLRCLVFVRSGGADLSGSRRLLAVHQ